MVLQVERIEEQHYHPPVNLIDRAPDLLFQHVKDSLSDVFTRARQLVPSCSCHACQRNAAVVINNLPWLLYAEKDLLGKIHKIETLSNDEMEALGFTQAQNAHDLWKNRYFLSVSVVSDWLQKNANAYLADNIQKAHQKHSQNEIQILLNAEWQTRTQQQLEASRQAFEEQKQAMQDALEQIGLPRDIKTSAKDLLDSLIKCVRTTKLKESMDYDTATKILNESTSAVNNLAGAESPLARQYVSPELYQAGLKVKANCERLADIEKEMPSDTSDVKIKLALFGGALLITVGILALIAVSQGSLFGLLTLPPSTMVTCVTKTGVTVTHAVMSANAAAVSVTGVISMALGFVMGLIGLELIDAKNRQPANLVKNFRENAQRESDKLTRYHFFAEKQDAPQVVRNTTTPAAPMYYTYQLNRS